LEGVTVHLKNTETITTTNASGTYQITVSPADARLVFSIVGFEQLELAVTPSGILNAVMVQAENTLDEVVVISYGTQKRELVTGAISSVSAQDLEKAPATQI